MAAADRFLASRESDDDQDGDCLEQSFEDDNTNENTDSSEKDADVEFENVWFNYPSRPDVTVLNGLNLKASSMLP